MQKMQSFCDKKVILDDSNNVAIKFVKCICFLEFNRIHLTFKLWILVIDSKKVRVQ